MTEAATTKLLTITEAVKAAGVTEQTLKMPFFRKQYKATAAVYWSNHDATGVASLESLPEAVAIQCALTSFRKFVAIDIGKKVQEINSLYNMLNELDERAEQILVGAAAEVPTDATPPTTAASDTHK